MFNFGIKKRFQSRSRNKVGLDLGSSAIKVVELEILNDKPSLAHIGLKSIPGTSRESMVESVKSLIAETGISTKEVNISVSGPAAIVRFVSMPRMREDELKSAIKFEAEKYIPFTISDCIVDYQILKKNEKENKFDVLLVAVKKQLVLDRIAVAEECGLNVGLVDVDTFAVANAFLKNFNTVSQDKTAALLNIGATMTNVGIVRDGILCFARDVAIGGIDFNAAISKGLNIDLRMAEELKISPGEKLLDVVNCTKGMVNNLLDEMRLSFSYYENQSGRGIDEIYISGGGSGLTGLEVLFHEAFESKPCLWDPLQFLDAYKVSGSDPLSTMKRSFAVAAGLAIR